MRLMKIKTWSLKKTSIFRLKVTAWAYIIQCFKLFQNPISSTFQLFEIIMSPSTLCILVIIPNIFWLIPLKVVLRLTVEKFIGRLHTRDGVWIKGNIGLDFAGKSPNEFVEVSRVLAYHCFSSQLKISFAR